ncbi:hypothetical protein, partial [Serratia sp. OLIL2]
MRNVKQVGFYCKNNVMKHRWRRLRPMRFPAEVHSALSLRIQRIIAVFYLSTASGGLLFYLARRAEIKLLMPCYT